MVAGSVRTPAEVISHGRQAQAELVRTAEAFAKVRSLLVEALLGTTFEQSDARERLYLSIQLLEPVQDMLRSAVNDGVAAEHAASIGKIMDESLPN